MWMSPSLILFVILIILSNLMIFSSPSLLISWVALELNTLSFIPLVLAPKHKISSEASMKYFLVQAIASIIFLFACLIENLPYFNNPLFLVCLVTALGIKLGAAPFHSWLPSVANSLSWETLYLFLTLQKINPLIIMSTSLQSNILIFIMASLSLIIGAIQGLSQTQTRLLLTFSSINHIGWLFTALMSETNLMFFYFILYMILLIPVILLLSFGNYFNINQLSKINMKTSPQLFLFLSLLSLGGLPPFLGFLPKWIVLYNLILSGSLIIPVVMILTSLITLYFYLRMTFSAFILFNLQWLAQKSQIMKISMVSILSTFLSLGGLLITFMF